MSERLLPTLALAAGLAACESEPRVWVEDYDWVWEQDHVTIYAYERTPDQVCGGSFAALELHSTTTAEFFGYDPDFHYDYRWLSEAVFDGKCGPGAGACTARGTPWTRHVPDMHESTHAVMWLGHGGGQWCPSVLREGLSDYLAGPRYHSWWDETAGEYVPWIGDLLTAAPLPGPEYERAGNFASFLIEEYGPERVAELCHAIPYYNTLDDWHAAVPEVLELELAELLAAYEDYPRCHGQQYRARLWECAGEPHAVADPHADLSFEVEMRCADEAMLGPLSNRMVAVRRIEFPEPMGAWIRLRDPSGAEVELDFNLQQCAACSDNPDVFANTELGNKFFFDAGVYELLIYAELDYAQTLTVSIEPEP